MLKATIILLALSAVMGTARADEVTLSTEYLATRAERLGNGVYTKVLYEKGVFDRLNCVLGMGYTTLEAGNEGGTRLEDISIIPIIGGVRYNLFGWLSLKGELMWNTFHLDTVHIPSAIGGYVGVELSKGWFFVTAGRQFGDMDINRALLEEASNVTGNLYGGGVRIKW